MVLGVDLGLLALLTIGTLLVALTTEAEGGSITKTAVWAQTAANALLFGIIPFLWVVYTRVGGLTGAANYLQWRPSDAGRGVLEGILLLIVTFVFVGGLSYLYTLLWGEPEVSPVIQAVIDILDWPLVLAIALVAGVAEEILFRGVLQRWIGVWGQAIVFGLSHAGYDTILNVAVPFVIGVGFGYVMKWRGNLTTVITAHFLYDLTLLTVAKLYPEEVT